MPEPLSLNIANARAVENLKGPNNNKPIVGACPSGFLLVTPASPSQIQQQRPQYEIAVQAAHRIFHGIKDGIKTEDVCSDLQISFIERGQLLELLAELGYSF